MNSRPIDRRILTKGVVVPALLAALAGSALAQEAPPAAVPVPAAPAPSEPPVATPPAEPKPERIDAATNRRVLDGPDTVLAFKNVKVSDVVPFIVEATGKVVMPQPEVMTRSITVLNDRPIPRQLALDMVIMAMHQIGVAVVEGPTIITLRDINEITRQDVPVVPGDESLLERTDYGSIVQKVYSMRNASAKNVGELIKDNVPDFAKIMVDEQSNQLAVLGNIGLLQRLEKLIASLDMPAAASLGSETFRLRYADAEQVATNIKELFAESQARTGNQNQQQNPFQNFFNRGGGNNNQQGGRGTRGNQNQQGGGGATGTDIATSANLRVTANTQQNSVTVLAERPILDQIRTQIDQFWDKPLPDEAVVPRVYDLKNSDPIKVRDLLEGLFGKGTTTTQGNNTTTAQGVGRLAGQFSFQAIPESGRLVVVAKSPDNLAVIDKIIQDLDQPQSIGLPEVVELKHANAEDLAEQLNTLLAQDGTLAQIRRSESGLSESTLTTSPFAQDAATTTANQNTQNNATTSASNIQFWWQRSRPPTDKAGASNLVGAIRIVPVWRQNALLVLAPPEYRASVSQLIGQLDRPGRQVLISAVVAEMSSDDATALGLRWSSSAITPTNPDNAIQFGTDQDRSGFIGSLFNSSVLDVNMNVNVLLQALSEKTDVQILSEPKIFTSDNQEAEFFDGQDIPFVTDSQTNNNGNLVQSFDYRAVGIQLRIRPRIANNKDVDVRVNLELSSIVPGETLFGGFVVDRRETTTQLILRDGQTVVISGIIRKEDSDITRKVPLLGDIPLLGALFTSKEKSVKSTELLVFITPIVVENPEERQKLNEPYQDRLNQMRLRLQDPEKEGKGAEESGESKPKKKTAQDFGYDG
ncbi:MAG: hypothetical protein IT434_17350 [Phycisphaerales bacterium]|jgi:general secretion pathway protein D|nr:hypothetical protein [Phycisphaerales bacterium]